MAPLDFATAAAGNAQTPTRNGAGGDWSRGRPNGATQTFRRPSGVTPMTHPDSPAAAASSNPPPRYVPPHRNGPTTDMRYSKDQLLDLYKVQQSTDGALNDGLPGLFLGGWQPDGANGASSAGWGRPEHGSRDGQPGPDVCWDRDGSVEPMGLADMDDEERELFSTSVNTPLKPPANTSKENQQSNGLPGRKISISNSATTPGGFGLSSPSLARTMGRRRDTSESYPFPSTNPLASPTAARDEQRAPSPPPALLRRRTDVRDNTRTEERDNGDDKMATTPFGTLKRNPTGPLSAGLGASSSTWANAPPSAGMSPMGSFGNFGLGTQQATATEKKPGLGSGRAESRFKNLLNKDSGEDLGSPTIQRKGSVSSLTRVNENESWRPQPSGSAALAETEEDVPSGSAALAGGSDMSPPQQRSGVRGFGTPSRPGVTDDFGFGTFGMTSDNAHGFGNAQGRDAFQQTPSAQRLGGNEPMSPTDTNPYQSPEQRGVDRLTEDLDHDGSDLHSSHLPGLGGLSSEQALGGLGGLGSMAHLGRGPGVTGPASDRSQTSSVGANRGFPGLSGLGQLGGVPGAAPWPSSQPGFGTPNRQTAGLTGAFGGGIFSNPMGDLQSPGLAGLGSAGLLGQQSVGGLGGSRMASMFPQSMQEQARLGEPRGDESTIQQQFGGLGAERDTDSPFGAQGFESNHEQSEQPGAQFGAPGQQHTADLQAPAAQPQQPGSSASNQPPPSQQRTMVMPDRMRWIYRDPQGQTQGPWSGLEMHDWYKAGFFSPELLVKKYEDPDYEPLAQLIRRIGNSREPFLVPQIGIPHGPANLNAGGPTTWAGGAGPVGSGPSSSGGAQPPFASSFPSFGTTLTADQQNALERRKQEEQYLMARQKEHLAQAQIAQRMQLHGVPGGAASSAFQGAPVAGLMPSQLHHHSSAQSLHSQPSFGSMTSPATAYQPSPIQAPSNGAAGNVQGFFDNSFRAPHSGGIGAVGSLGHIREEEIPGIMDRLNLGGGNGNRTGAGQFGAPGQPFAAQQSSQDGQGHSQQVQQMLQDRAALQQEQAQQGSEPQAPSERLKEFQQLQGQTAGGQLDTRFQPPAGRTAADRRQTPELHESRSLTEQVEAAVSAQQSPVPQQSVGLPQPFPPPPAPSQSPLPAPSAQRTGRQSVADQLQTEHDHRDHSQTPSVETPSAAVAPWAKEATAEAAPKGPSLKQIQAAEAKKAAEAEALAAAARRAAFEKELEASAAAAAASTPQQPGLPASASWATGASPSTPTGNASFAAWAKAAQKPTGSTAAPAKTMAQIQKEEEARKKKLAAAAATAHANVLTSAASAATSKSYANLAGKTAPAAASPASAWTTVGAGGKTKAPVAAAPTPSPGLARTASTGVPALKKAPSRSATATSATIGNGTGAVNAQEEFRKWAVAELRPDLNKGISAEEFVSGLLCLPPEPDMITEAVHAVSLTMDSRHFAEEYLRRKRLADKGLVDTSAPVKTASPLGGTGWSEVAKKGPASSATAAGTGKGDAAKEAAESSAAFRVVAGKKKGGKR